MDSRPMVTIIFILIVFFIGYFLGAFVNTTTVIIYNETGSRPVFVYQPFEPGENTSFITMLVPAVDNEGEGLTTLLSVQVTPGSGRVLANIDKLLFWTDTQNSIRTSKSVAENITGLNLSQYDIIYTVETEATAVEGPSAGAALTIATIAALEHKKINPEVMITGAVNHDGTIGPVGETLPKAKAAKASGAKLFLVPLLQSHEVTYRTKRYCEQIGAAEICTTERIPEKVSIAEEAGIEVKEVGSIREALEYFLLEE